MTQTSPKSLRARLRGLFLTVVLVLLAAATLAFVLDFAVYRIRVTLNRDPYGSVLVNHYTAVLQKNGKTTMTFDPPQTWVCVNAVFPHGGSLPCWYLRRHPDQRTDI